MCPFVYLTSGKYNTVNIEAKAELYHCENIFVGTSAKSEYYQFDMILPDVKCLYLGNDDHLSENAIEYYDRINADIRCIYSAESIYRKND